MEAIVKLWSAVIFRMNNKLRNALCLAAVFAAGLVSYAQPPQPLNWSVSTEQKAPNTYKITANGLFTDSAWHIYDLVDRGSTGPNATVFKVEGAQVIEGPEIVSEIHLYDDAIFGMEIGICPGPVKIVSTIKVSGKKVALVPVTIVWQCCNDGSCLPPTEWTKTLELPVDAKAMKAEAKAAAEKEVVAPAADLTQSGNSGLLALIIEAILWGFAMLLTPCVFPMIPMTISFFMKGSGTKAQGKFKAAMYGLFIVLLYTIPICIIIGLTWVLGGDSVTADIFNWLATHWLPNLIFFAIFMIFAASFFGAFEITLPSKWVNGSDSRSDSKGLGGIFFLALTLVLVSFSCTGPIVGTVLIKSTQGEFWTPMVTMLAFSLAFALPFTVFAFFPSLLKNLPKSGGWLNSVKVVLGFIEIALGFKFLSTADQTYHWHLLDREVYLAIWIVTFSLLGLYLLGKISFANDSPIKHLTVTRLALAITVFSFVVYMIPGMWGAPLKALSGYLPPITTQDFVLQSGPDSVSLQASSDRKSPSDHKYADFLHLPYNLPGYFDYQEALEAAKTSGKPLFVDFTGHGCVNCREMETRVWSDPRVLEMMRNDYVVCALYADDKKVLDEKDWVTTADGRVLKSLGKINSHFALERFGVNAQPYYAIINPESGELKVPSRGYNLDVEAFVEWLKSGID